MSHPEAPRLPSISSVRLTTSAISASSGFDGIHSRQELIAGWHQPALAAASILVIGAGGLGGEICESLVRKGIGRLTIIDHDVVELSNLNRQRFYESQVGQYKAVALASNLAREATDSTTIAGIAEPAEIFLANIGEAEQFDVVVCGVDNERTRVAAAQHFHTRTPVIMLAVDETAEHGYVFVAEKDGACFACFKPSALDDTEDAPCARAGAVKDILKTVCGIAGYAVDSLLMPGRHRDWNLYTIYLAGFGPTSCGTVERRVDCGVCGHGK